MEGSMMLDELTRNYPQLYAMKGKIFAAYEMMRGCYLEKKKVLLCGNGGSTADCEHIAGELLKEYRIKRGIPRPFAHDLKKYGADDLMIQNIVGALPALSLTSHIGFITAFCNDNAAEYMFAQQLYAFGERGDILFGITTSGNSKNVINAAIVAKAMGIKVIILTGKSGGDIKQYADVLLNVPEKDTARIQELHLPVYHTLCAMLEEYFFLENTEQTGRKDIP